MKYLSMEIPDFVDTPAPTLDGLLFSLAHEFSLWSVHFINLVHRNFE
jgi:hypothetical protein